MMDRNLYEVKQSGNYKKCMNKILVFILLLIYQLAWASNDTSIKKLKSKADDYLNTAVSIEGMLVKRDSSDEKVYMAKTFLIHDKSNDTIEVRLEEKTELEYGADYEIKGKLKRNEDGKLLIDADQYECIDCEDEKKESNSTLFLIIGIAALILVLLIASILKQRKKEPRVNPVEKYTRSSKNISIDPIVNSSDAISDYKTIAFNINELPKKKEQPASPAKTVVMQKPQQTGIQLLPGNFTILAGSSPQEEIKLFGKFTSLGLIATVGREPGSQDRRKTHLEVGNNTVSRRPAAIIYRDNTLILKNLSSTNPTRMGTKEMKVGEELELFAGATVTMGTVLIRYSK